MPIQLDRSEIKAEARSLIRSGTVSPIRMTLFYLAITLVLSLVNSGITFISGAQSLSLPSAALADALPRFSLVTVFIAILISLISTVLSAGYTCYCLGIQHRVHMPYASLFDAFSFAGKVILLELVQAVFIFLWSLLFFIPGIVAAYRYSFAVMDLCENPDLGVMEALKLSKQQTFGYKWQLFLLHLSFFGWALLASLIVSCYDLLLASLLPETLFGVLLDTLLYALFSAVASLYLTPYLELSKCGFYLRATAPIVDEAAPLPENDRHDDF